MPDRSTLHGLPIRHTTGGDVEADGRIAEVLLDCPVWPAVHSRIADGLLLAAACRGLLQGAWCAASAARRSLHVGYCCPPSRRGRSIAEERVDDEGIIERRCRKCGDWMVLSLFCRDINCFRGRTHECKPCRQKRRAL